MFCSPPPHFQGKRRKGKRRGRGPALTQRGGDRLGVLQLPGAAAAGYAVRAGAGGAHANAVGVVGGEQGCGHAVFQQRRLDEHGVPPVVGHFRHSLKQGRVRPRGSMADKKWTCRFSRGQTAGSCRSPGAPSSAFPPSTVPHQSSARADLEAKTADGARRERFLAEFFQIGGSSLLPCSPPRMPPPPPPGQSESCSRYSVPAVHLTGNVTASAVPYLASLGFSLTRETSFRSGITYYPHPDPPPSLRI